MRVRCRSYNPVTTILGGDGRFSIPSTSKFPLGPPPLDCYDICYEDKQCHGSAERTIRLVQMIRLVQR